MIRRMAEDLEFRTRIVILPTVRERDGLAMSSRNTRLTPEERKQAPEIYAALAGIKENYSWFIPEGVKQLVTGQLNENPAFRVEYVEIVDTQTLQPFADWMDAEHAVVCVAVYLGAVRLIDNKVLY